MTDFLLALGKVNLAMGTASVLQPPARDICCNEARDACGLMSAF